MDTPRRSYAKPVATAVTNAAAVDPPVLLVGPYDPACRDDTFQAPPLGVWRLAGVLAAAGAHVEVFDPNSSAEPAAHGLAKVLASRSWRLIGFSTTGTTLRFDLGLAHLARRLCADALIVAGGMEAALNAETLFRVGPFDLIVLGQGERPLLEIVDRLRQGLSTSDLRDVRGTAWIDASGEIHRLSQPALDRQAFREATFQTPYARMPYQRYWDKLTHAYRLHDLPMRAEREARLAEVQAIPLNTLNDGPIPCACSPAHVPNGADGPAARVTRLEADECVSMIARIVSACPDVRTIVFQDDTFVFNTDQRVRPLCEGILAAKHAEVIPLELQFISTSRIDSMDKTRLGLLKRAGFRMVGFGVESFSRDVLTEFNKAHIWDSIAPNLHAALKFGLTPSLDLMLTSPRCSMKDVAGNITAAFKWLSLGCEAAMHPYVVPFAGTALARDRELLPFTVTTGYTIDGTGIQWDQPTKILPIDPLVRDAILEIERAFAERLTMVEAEVARLPSSVRSLLWIACAIPVLTPHGEPLPSLNAAVRALVSRLPMPPARVNKFAAQLTAVIGRTNAALT